MTPAQRLAVSEGFLGAADRRKRLGQFFTGTGLGRLLGALAGATAATSIVDPMSGTGDLLAACLELGASPSIIGAVEIDPVAHSACSLRLPDAFCVLGNAFDPSVIERLPAREWDLVIANPPYVRYQNMSQRAGARIILPGAVEVRTGLMAMLKAMTSLDPEDRRLFLSLVSGYSGLADLAVPSWILCASMVRIGGRLALVVPESWLSRDYAAVVQYLLLRWFVVEQVVEDEHAVWFPDAQVKTTLLVARRVKRRESAFSWTHETFARTRVSGKAATTEGPIARLYPGTKKPEPKLAQDIAKVMRSGKALRLDLCEVVLAPISQMSQSFQSVASSQKWFSEVGEALPQSCAARGLPRELSSWVGDGGKGRFLTLEELGVSVGQGLRTGANRFFYAELLRANKKTALISTDSSLTGGPVRVPVDCLIPVVRKQVDLPPGFSVRASDLTGRVLDLRRVALREDILAGGRAAMGAYAPMDDALADFVRSSAATNLGTDEEFRSIKELSAVAPNVRAADPKKGTPPRFWYMLPDFAPRHTPDLVVPRVNGGSPRAILIADKGVVADANFSTLNVSGPSTDAHAVLALINSDWCRAILENSAAVMGGGALKVEAAHLRRLPIPRITPEEWVRLSKLGEVLAKTGKGLRQINYVVASAALGRQANKVDVSALATLANDGRARRESHG